MLRLQPDHFQVTGSRPHVGGGDVPTSQAVNMSSVGPQQCFPVVATRVGPYDALAPSQGQARSCRLVGHGLRQAQGVEQGVFFAGIVPHAGASTARPQGGVVQGNESLETHRRLGTDQHPFMSVLAHVVKYVHHCPRFIIVVWRVGVLRAALGLAEKVVDADAAQWSRLLAGATWAGATWG